MMMIMKFEFCGNTPSLASEGLHDYDDEVFLPVFLSELSRFRIILCASFSVFSLLARVASR